MLPDFGTGGVGTPREAWGDIPGVAFSWSLLLLDFPHLRRVSKGIDKAVEQGTRDFYHIGWFLRYP